MSTKERMNTYRRNAITVGILFIIGTVAGILSVFITVPILDDPNYLSLIATNKTQLVVGAVFLLTMDLSLTMVPVVIFPNQKHEFGN